jgi:tetratricopeptide (TPR) repeat protein
MIAWSSRTHKPRLPSPRAGEILVSLSSSSDLGLFRGQLVGDIPQEPPGFQPRAKLLAELDRTAPGVPMVHAMTGMQGTGKTNLAAAYVRARPTAGRRLVAWVNAGDQISLLAGLAAVADATGLSVGARMPVGDAALAVRRRLETDGNGCLVVFDNVSDPDVLRPFVPAAGAARVLITSGRQTANLGIGVPVDAFSPDQALTFLADRTGVADAAEAAAVAAELGYLPLALAQAAAVITSSHLRYRTYLERLRALPAQEYLSQGQEQPYPPGVLEAVLLNLEGVRAGDQGGVRAGVMEIMAVLSAAGVRRELLHAAGQAIALVGGSEAEVTADVVDRALTQLAERSLLTFSLGGQTIAAHQLVMRVIRDSLTRLGRLATVCRTASSVLDAYAEALKGSQDRRALRDIPGQVAALLDNTPVSAGEADEELARSLLSLRFRALHRLNELGDSAAQAIAVGEPLTADFDRVLGPDHHDTLLSWDSLAVAYASAGRTAEAIALFEQTLAAREHVLGPGHPDSLQSRDSLAEAYQSAGRTAEAIALFEQTLAAREHALGPDHPRTLTSRNDLAEAYMEANRATEAIRLHEQTLAARERILGPDHPATLSSRDNLATAVQDAGRAAEAIPLFEQTLAAREHALGPDHPDTLTSRDNLALAYWAAGQVAEAIPLFEQTLATQNGVLGPDHPDTLTSRNNLATAYWAGGRAAQAIPLHEQTLAARERVLGPDHPATLTSRNNLAAAYRDADRAAEAIPLFQQVLAARERVLGPDHPATLTSRNNLAAARSKRSRRSAR